MAHSIADQVAGYPLAAYNFRVTVSDVAMGFAEVSGLAREFETLTYRHGLSFTEGEEIVRFRLDKYVPLTLKRGVVKGLPQLREWLESGDKRPISVSLCDESGDPVVTWRVQKAVPTKLESPALQASAGDAAVESLTLMASGITIETH
ncbi:MAG: phage tail protein [Burkholderiaceae bacterium]|nr:phage tail protein [Burkholderiaceae bacterium]